MSVLPAIQEIKSSLSSLPTGTKVIAYTDGSTSSRGNNANSGSGIFITTSNHERLWEGGLVVRADGNNFIAELAAVAMVLRACPPHLNLLLRIDSMATIGAVTKGVV